MTYRAYLRTFDGQVSEKTITKDQAAAAEAFASLVDRTDLDGQKMAAALTYNNGQLAFHRFDRRPGDADYWRDKLDEIPWPSHGGPNRGQGLRAADGATGLERKNITIDPARADVLRAFGDGDLSLVIRRAADHIASCKS